MRRAIVSAAVVLTVAAAVALADEAEAVKLIQSSGGTVQRDESKPGKPVVAVTLGPNAGEREAKALANFKELSSLFVDGPFTDAAAKGVAELKSLQTLILRNAKGLTDGGLKEFARLTGLKQLVLMDATGVTGEGFKALAGRGEMFRLAVSVGKLTDEHLRVVGGMKKLADVVLFADKSEVTDAGVKVLAGLTEVRSLALAGRA